MANLLVKVVFGIINTLYNIIFAPLLSGITALFPDISIGINKVTEFLNMALTYFVTCVDLLMIPHDALSFLFLYYLTKVTIYYAIQAVKFTKTVYETLKP